MMVLTNDEVVVYTICAGVESWYVSERDPWVLDLPAWAKIFEDAGYDVPDHGILERSDMPVLDQHNAGKFLERMLPFRKEAGELRGARDFDGHLAYPVLGINFDEQNVVIGDVDSPAFQNYLPDGWSAQFGDPSVWASEEMVFWDLGEANPA